MKNTSNKIITKVCSNKKCLKEKPISEFHKTKANKDGLQNYCKMCDASRRLYLYRTKKGVAQQIYCSQVSSSAKRGHPVPEYTKKEFIKWLFSKNIFHELFLEWEQSGYDSMLKPSCDRHSEIELNYDELPYSFKRLRVVTWKENKKKSNKDIRSGLLKRKKIQILPVSKFGLNGVLLENYISIMDANRQTDVDISDISKCCNFIKKTAGGFQWRFYGFEKNNKPKDISNDKKVVQLSLCDELIKEFSSIKEASISTETISSSISACCRGLRRTANGFKWESYSSYFKL